MRRPPQILALIVALVAVAAGAWSPVGSAPSAPTCSVCGRPVSGQVRRLSDGRLLCATDASRAVLEPEEARRVFWGAVAAVNSALGPEFKLRNRIEAVELVDRSGMRRVASERGQVRGEVALGLFRFRKQGDLATYTVYLLSGLPRERLVTVAAHEYGHAWHAENNPRYQEVTRSLREGLAEWVAWSTNTRLGRSGELAFMGTQRDPDYVHGLGVFRALERAGGRDAAIRAARTRVR